MLLQGHERRAIEKRQVVQREPKERMQTPEGFQLHHVNADRRRDCFPDDRDPAGRDDGK